MLPFVRVLSSKRLRKRFDEPLSILDPCCAAVKRFVYFQTALCYGRPERVPIPVEHATRPFTSYGISKTAGEAYVAISDLSWISLRLANVTGPRLAIGPIPTFYKRLKSGQKCFCTDAIRDFLDMSDFLALMRVALCAEAPQGIFNVSTGEGHTVAEVFDAVASCLGISPAEPVPVVPPAPPLPAGRSLLLSLEHAAPMARAPSAC